MKKYYIRSNGIEYTEETRDEIASKIDIHDPKTFLPYLKELDYPYYKKEMNISIEKYGHLGSRRVFSNYLGKMQLKGYRAYRYKDSDFLNQLSY